MSVWAGVWTPGAWGAGVWYEGGAQAVVADVAPGWGSVTRRRRKRAAEVDEDERPVEPPVIVPEPDRDAPLREFIARQELRDRTPSVPEPRPFDPTPMLEAKRLEAERRRRRTIKFLLLLTE